MAREISPVCNFIFRSIWTELLTDTVDIELTIRMVKGKYTYRKDIWPNPQCFCHGVGLLFPFPHYKKRYKHIKTRIDRHQHGIKDMLHPIFLHNPSPNVGIPWEKPELNGPIRGIGLTL